MLSQCVIYTGWAVRFMTHLHHAMSLSFDMGYITIAKMRQKHQHAKRALTFPTWWPFCFIFAIVLSFWEDVNIGIVKFEENDVSNSAKLKKRIGLLKGYPKISTHDEYRKH